LNIRILTGPSNGGARNPPDLDSYDSVLKGPAREGDYDGASASDLIGRSGDGWVIPLSSYISNDQIRASQQLINVAAKKNGRPLDSVARVANIVGVIDEKGELNRSSGEKSPFVGSSSQWVDRIVSSYSDLGVDTFVFWPSAQGQEENQLRLFAERVVPKVQASLAEKKKQSLS